MTTVPDTANSAAANAQKQTGNDNSDSIASTIRPISTCSSSC